MFTPREKKVLIDLLNTVQVTGTITTIGKTLAELDALIKKIEAMPVEESKEAGSEKSKPKRHRH